MIGSIIATLVAVLFLLHPVYADSYPLSQNDAWQVELYVSNKDSTLMSCDLVTRVPGHSFSLEYWNDSTVIIRVRMYRNESEPFPSEITLQLRIDNEVPYTFSNARNYGSHISFSQHSGQTIWSMFINELAYGNVLFVLDNHGARLDPGFRLTGSRATIEDWKTCIKKLNE